MLYNRPCRLTNNIHKGNINENILQLQPVRLLGNYAFVRFVGGKCIGDRRERSS